jgi:hypothetical protein
LPSESIHEQKKSKRGIWKGEEGREEKEKVEAKGNGKESKKKKKEEKKEGKGIHKTRNPSLNGPLKSDRIKKQSALDATVRNRCQSHDTPTSQWGLKVEECRTVIIRFPTIYRKPYPFQLG